MGSRIRENPVHLFECFFEVVIPSESESRPWIIQKFPAEYDDQEILKSVPEFCCPCPFTNATIQHYSFVLTSLDSNWSFGYCRHSPEAPTLFIFLSYLPWHETFYKILNQISDLTNSKETSLLVKFLDSLYNSPVPDPGLNLHVPYNDKEFIVYCPNHLKLPSIPESRNLTEYFNATDANNMIVIFASMLHERRILVVSKKLSRLSACVQAANSLIYPMHWQHIFIPVLPKHLIDYLSAPMPYLIGVPATTLEKFRQSELNEVVIFDADNNRVRTPFKDLETLPPDIVSSLRRSLKNPSLMLGDGVSRAFMRALVKLIGGYRDSLKFTLGQKISFDADAFIQTRSASVQPFLETMLHLQIFQQFIENRLDMLNSGIGFSDEFEYEVNSYEVNSSNNLKTQYKEWVNTMKKEGGAFFKNVKSRTNPAVKYAYKSVKDKGKRAYKDIRLKIQDIQKSPNQHDMNFDRKFRKPKSAPSSPTSLRANSFGQKRISYNETNAALDSIALSNSLALNAGVRRYKMLAVDEISLPSEGSPEGRNSPHLQTIDMDLMEELRDVVFRRCSVSSDNLNSLGIIDETIEDVQSMNLGFSDSFCVNSKPLPAPLPPPRARRNPKPVSERPTENTNPTSSTENPLIQLESLDDVSLFDPLKEPSAKDSDLLTFLAPASDSKVAELKNTIQQINNSNSQTFFQPFCGAPGVSVHPGMVLPKYPVVHAMVPPAQGNCFGNSSFQGTTSVPTGKLRDTVPRVQRNCFGKSSFLDTTGVPEVKPPLPLKTRNSTFFVPTCASLSDVEQNLINDYGLSNSPLFRRNTGVETSVPEATTNLLQTDPFVQSEKESNKSSHPSWQKFT